MVRGKKREIESQLSDEEAQRLAEGLFLTREEVCEKLSICLATLWKLTTKKKIPSIRIGRSIRYPKIAVEEYCARELQRMN